MGWFSKPQKSEWDVAAKALREMTCCSTLASPDEVCRAIKTVADTRDAYLVALERSHNALNRTTKKLDEAESRIAVLRGIIDRSLAAIDFPQDFDVSRLPDVLKDQTERLWEMAHRRGKEEHELANMAHKLEVLQQAHEKLQEATKAPKTSATLDVLREVLGLDTSTPDERVAQIVSKDLSDLREYNHRLKQENHELVNVFMDFKAYKRNAEDQLRAKDEALKAIQKKAHTFRQEVVSAVGSGLITDTTFTGAVNMVKDLKKGFEAMALKDTEREAKIKELCESGKDIRDKLAQFRSSVASSLGINERLTTDFDDHQWSNVLAGLRNQTNNYVSLNKALRDQLRATDSQNDLLRAEIKKAKEANDSILQNIATELGLSDEVAKSNDLQYILDAVKATKEAVGFWQRENEHQKKEYQKACNTYDTLHKVLQADASTWITKCQCLEADKRLLMEFQDAILEALGRPQPPASSSNSDTTKSLAWIVDLVRERGNVKADEVQEFQRCWKECASILGVEEKIATELLEERGPSWLVESFGRLQNALKAYEKHAHKKQAEADESRKQVEALTLDVDRQTKRVHLFTKKIRDILVMPSNWSYDKVIDTLVFDASSCVKLRDSRLDDKKRKTCILFEFPSD